MKKHCDATIIFLFNEDKTKVLMLDRVNTSYGFEWGFVCGKGENGEKPIETAKRELFEELKLKDIELIKLKTINYEKDGEKYFHHYYYSIIPENSTLEFQKKEIKAIKWFYLDELPKNRAPDDPKEVLEHITKQSTL